MADTLEFELEDVQKFGREGPQRKYRPKQRVSRISPKQSDIVAVLGAELYQENEGCSTQRREPLKRYRNNKMDEYRITAKIEIP